MTTWQETLAAWWRRSFRPLLVAVLVGCGVHYTIYSNNLINFDAEHVGSLYIADGWAERLYWETQQGRAGGGWGTSLEEVLQNAVTTLSRRVVGWLGALPPRCRRFYSP